ESKAFFVDTALNDNAVKSSRNIATIKTANVKNITVYDLLKYDKFFVTEAAVKKLEEVLG
ncbi:50S ribosomal protein L4, partial [Candidatus Termititenax spirochaetophilus]